jgi:hypothetical protein
MYLPRHPPLKSLISLPMGTRLEAPETLLLHSSVAPVMLVISPLIFCYLSVNYQHKVQTPGRRGHVDVVHHLCPKPGTCQPSGCRTNLMDEWVGSSGLEHLDPDPASPQSLARGPRSPCTPAALAETTWGLG